MSDHQSVSGSATEPPKGSPDEFPADDLARELLHEQADIATGENRSEGGISVHERKSVEDHTFEGLVAQMWQAVDGEVSEPAVAADVDFLFCHTQPLRSSAREALLRGADRGVEFVGSTRLNFDALREALEHLLENAKEVHAQTNVLEEFAGFVHELHAGPVDYASINRVDAATWARDLNFSPSLLLAALDPRHAAGQQAPYEGLLVRGADTEWNDFRYDVWELAENGSPSSSPTVEPDVNQRDSENGDQ